MCVCVGVCWRLCCMNEGVYECVCVCVIRTRCVSVIVCVCDCDCVRVCNCVIVYVIVYVIEFVIVYVWLSVWLCMYVCVCRWGDKHPYNMHTTTTPRPSQRPNKEPSAQTGEESATIIFLMNKLNATKSILSADTADTA